MSLKAEAFVTVTNISNQMVPIQVQPPGGDFYLEQRQVRLLPGKSVVLPHSHLMDAQLENLRGRQQLRIANAH